MPQVDTSEDSVTRSATTVGGEIQRVLGSVSVGGAAFTATELFTTLPSDTSSTIGGFALSVTYALLASTQKIVSESRRPIRTSFGVELARRQAVLVVLQGILLAIESGRPVAFAPAKLRNGWRDDLDGFISDEQFANDAALLACLTSIRTWLATVDRIGDSLMEELVAMKNSPAAPSSDYELNYENLRMAQGKFRELVVLGIDAARPTHDEIGRAVYTPSRLGRLFGRFRARPEMERDVRVLEGLNPPLQGGQ